MASQSMERSYATPCPEQKNRTDARSRRGPKGFTLCPRVSSGLCRNIIRCLSIAAITARSQLLSFDITSGRSFGATETRLRQTLGSVMRNFQRGWSDLHRTWSRNGPKSSCDRPAFISCARRLQYGLKEVV